MKARTPLASLILAAIASSTTALAQTPPTVALEGLDGRAVLAALARECYEAGLVPEQPTETILDCSVVVAQRTLGAGAAGDEERIVVTHRVRFTLLEGGAGRVDAEAWTETAELGTVIEQPVTAEEYLSRVQRVLTTAAEGLRDRSAPPWVGRYASERDWHLDAHLRAVSRCEAALAGMTAESVAGELRSIGLRPLDDDTRDRCEQLYTHLFEWGLSRGDAEPTVAAYARYRAALPAEQRSCSGQLAPEADCPQ